MPKIFCMIAIAFGLTTGAVAQATFPSCSIAMVAFSGQSAAITRTGFGTPYSLTATIKSERKLADGNTISGFITSRQVRDGEGRTRVDNPSACLPDKNMLPRWQGSVFVTDPVAKTTTSWQVGSFATVAVASVTHHPSMKAPSATTPQQEYSMAQLSSHSYDYADPKVKHESLHVEDLGNKNILGLEASGFRITRTTPAGLQGNSLPLISVEEKWFSVRYGVVLQDTQSDPVFGETTYEVTDFAPGEPDASLFKPPADYKINERN